MQRFSVVLLAVVLLAPRVEAQPSSAERGSRNVQVVSHLSLQAPGEASEQLANRPGDVELDQEPGRPFVYVGRWMSPAGFDVVSLDDPAQPELLYSWQDDDEAVRAGDVKYFKAGDRYYVVLALRQQPSTGSPAVGAVVFDVTGLPEPSSVREVARIRGGDEEGGFRNLFVYRHSDGRTLLFATGGGDVWVYDLEKTLSGDENQGLVTRLATPEQLDPTASGYHNVFVGFDRETQQDRFYGAGAGGYYVYDVTSLDQPRLLTSISSAAVHRGHTIAPTPDGRYVVTAAEYRLSPLRIFDLQPGLNGELNQIRTAVGAWTADWRHFSQNFEVRWPFVFVAALYDGFQVFNMRDPANPYTDAYYRTCEATPPRLAGSEADLNGAWDIDVRNADGLIVLSDLSSGLWVFRVEGFEGWHGHGWGLPNMSSVQDWENWPDGRWETAPAGGR